MGYRAAGWQNQSLLPQHYARFSGNFEYNLLFLLYLSKYFHLGYNMVWKRNTVCPLLFGSVCISCILINNESTSSGNYPTLVKTTLLMGQYGVTVVASLPTSPSCDITANIPVRLWIDVTFRGVENSYRVIGYLYRIARVKPLKNLYLPELWWETFCLTKLVICRIPCGFFVKCKVSKKCFCNNLYDVKSLCLWHVMLCKQD